MMFNRTGFTTPPLNHRQGVFFNASCEQVPMSEDWPPMLCVTVERVDKRTFERAAQYAHRARGHKWAKLHTLSAAVHVAGMPADEVPEAWNA